MTNASLRPLASAIVRCLNKIDTIERTLRSLRAQSAAIEIVAVDSGSTDGTLDVLRQYADTVIEISPSEFTYGRALNIGAEAASAPIHFAVSAHVFPENPMWVANALAHYDRDEVAATNGFNGAVTDPHGRPILDVYFQRYNDALDNPYWGFSNTAASWRADVWRRFPFREDLIACEDKEWSWRVLESGMTIAYDKALDVPSHHRRAAGLSELLARSEREAYAIASLRDDLPNPTAARLLMTWWGEFPYPSTKPKMLRRFGPHRTVELLGRYRGERRGHDERRLLPA